MRIHGHIAEALIYRRATAGAQAVEQVAARSAERERLWNLSQDMLARADYGGMMSAVSPAWEWVLGWSTEELLSRGYAMVRDAGGGIVTSAARAQADCVTCPTCGTLVP